MRVKKVVENVDVFCAQVGEHPNLQVASVVVSMRLRSGEPEDEAVTIQICKAPHRIMKRSVCITLVLISHRCGTFVLASNRLMILTIPSPRIRPLASTMTFVSPLPFQLIQ